MNLTTATTKQVRRIVRNVFGEYINKGFAGSYTWTDKMRGGADRRSVAFRIGYGMAEAERQAIEKQVKDAFWMLGYDNKIPVTDSTEQQRADARLWHRDDSGTYLRIKAVIG